MDRDRERAIARRAARLTNVQKARLHRRFPQLLLAPEGAERNRAYAIALGAMPIGGFDNPRGGGPLTIGSLFLPILGVLGFTVWQSLPHANFGSKVIPAIAVLIGMVFAIAATAARRWEQRQRAVLEYVNWLGVGRFCVRCGREASPVDGDHCPTCNRGIVLSIPPRGSDEWFAQHAATMSERSRRCLLRRFPDLSRAPDNQAGLRAYAIALGAQGPNTNDTGGARAIGTAILIGTLGTPASIAIGVALTQLGVPVSVQTSLLVGCFATVFISFLCGLFFTSVVAKRNEIRAYLNSIGAAKFCLNCAHDANSDGPDICPECGRPISLGKKALS